MQFLRLLLFNLVVVASFLACFTCVAQLSLAAPAVGIDGLSATLEARGGAVFVGGLEILSEIGSFEIYKVAPGQRATLLAGPSSPKNSIGVLSNRVTFEGNEEGDRLRYTYALHWENSNTLRVRVEYRSPLGLPTGMGFCIGKLASGLFAGSTLTSGTQILRLPVTPRPMDDRYLLQKRSALSVRSIFVDIAIVPVEGDISVADFRTVPWDRYHSFYLYSNRRFIVPGQKATFCYDLVFSKGTLTADSQFEQDVIKPVLPPAVDSTSFFPSVSKRQPDLPVRGVLSELLPPALKDISLFKGYIRAIAKAGGNTLVLYHNPEHVLALQTDTVTEQWWSRQDLKEISEYAHSLGINVIPGMKCKFKAEHFPRLSNGGNNSFYNTFDSASYQKIFALYQTLLDIYRPTALLIGHDEIVGLGKGKPDDWSDARVLAADIEKISGWLLKKGVVTMIFGDMLLDHKRWPNLITANSNNPLYASTDTHDALDQLPKDIVILDWQYFKADDYPTIEYFKKKGFVVWGVSWYDPFAAVAFTKSLIRYKGDGILASDWGLWSTLSPSATSLYAVKAGTDSSITVRSDGEDAALALAGEMRGAGAEKMQSGFFPVGLDKITNESTMDSAFDDGRGFVDLSSAFDLRALPSGQQDFAGIPFRILPTDDNGKTNCLIAAGPEKLTIPMDQKRVKTLAFLHTMRQALPQVGPRPVGSYEVIYVDGKREHIFLREGYNITDVRSGAGVRRNPWGFYKGTDILLGSFLGWRGPSLSGMPMNLQVMLWDNPEPNNPISEIIVSPKEGTRLVLLALSVKL